MGAALTVEELRALAVWGFPARLSEVLDRTMTYQTKLAVVRRAEEAVEEERAVAELAGELRDQVHPAHRLLIESTIARASNLEAVLADARTELEAGASAWVAAVGQDNIGKLLKWFDEHDGQGTHDSLNAFILAEVPSAS